MAEHTILVVDDEDVVLRFIVATLRKAGYAVISASTGPAALVLCRERDTPVDLALLDVMMPGMNGPQLLTKLREMWPVRVLFMSGYSQSRALTLSRPAEGSLFMEKPFTPAKLLARVKEALEAGRKRTNSAGA